GFERKLQPKHRSTSCSEPRTGERGSRQAKHGCFARESGQDVVTERKAIPGRQGVASNSKPAKNFRQSPTWGRTFSKCGGGIAHQSPHGRDGALPNRAAAAIRQAPLTGSRLKCAHVRPAPAVAALPRRSGRILRDAVAAAYAAGARRWR